MGKNLSEVQKLKAKISELNNKLFTAQDAYRSLYNNSNAHTIRMHELEEETKNLKTKTQVLIEFMFLMITKMGKAE